VSGFGVRTATQDDLGMMLDWAAEEGWNPGLDDAGPLYAADRGGYLIGCLDGEPLACISVVTYGADFAFLGFYICRPEFRGQGHGMAIWNAGIDHVGRRTIGLDGVVAQQSNYAKSGFKFAHNNIRYAGMFEADRPTDPHLIALEPSTDPGLVNAIVDYDRAFFPGPRDGFLRAWISQPRYTIAYIEDQVVRGYGTVRACRTGSKIGPLFADNETIGAQLFDALAAHGQGGQIIVDVPEPNRVAIGMAERYGLEPVFETARMYRGDDPNLPIERMVGITTFELG